MTKKLAALALGLAALVLSPVAACSMFLEPDFYFGPAELRAAVEGTWTVTVPSRADASPLEYTIVITQARTKLAANARTPSLVASASACGDRSLVRSASACAQPKTTMSLEIQIVNGPSPDSSSGEIVVVGADFSVGRLEANVDGHRLISFISRDGVATTAVLFVDDHDRDANMVRMAPAAAAAPAPAPRT